MHRIHAVIRKAGLLSLGLLLALVLQRAFIKGILWLARLLYDLKIIGEENIPQKEACIIAFPLAALTDAVGPLFLKSVRPDSRALGTCRWVANSPKPDLLTSWAHVALGRLQQGYPVALLPEGGFRWDGRPRPVKPGAAWMALHAHVPVVVIVVKGGYDIWPRWASRPKLTGKLTIRVGKPFYLSDRPWARVNEAMIRLATEKIVDEIARLEHDDP